MSGNKDRRPISVGTFMMLMITIAVVVGMGMVLTRLSGGGAINIDPGKMLGSLSLSDVLPKLTLSDMNIRQQETATPEAIATTGPTPTPYLIPAAGPAVSATPRVTDVPATPTPVPRGGTFTMTVGGSVCVETGVRQSGYYKDAKAYDFEEILSLIAAQMDSDVNLVTLENVVNPSSNTSGMSDLVAPAAVMGLLTSGGVDTVALGFSKAYDKGYDGLAATIAAAQEKQLRVIGANRDQSEPAVQLLELGGVRVALLHVTDYLSKTGQSLLKKDGRSWALPRSAEIEQSITAARAAGADVVIVSVNWGSSGKAATKAQKALAQKMADAGADVILGAGARIVQSPVWLTGRMPDGSEKRTLCLYSLGCLIGDTRTDGQVAGMLLKLRISCDAAGRVTFEQTGFVPTYVWRFKQDNMYSYRVVVSNDDPPDGMESSQQTSMKRALTNVRKAVGSVLTEVE